MDRGSALGYWLTAVVSAVLLVMYALGAAYPDSWALFTDYATPVFAGVAAAIAVIATRGYGIPPDNKFSWAWLLLAVGMSAWFVAELGWAIYVLALNVPIPYPSIADVFYVAGYPFFIVGVLLYVSLFSPALTRRRMAVASVVVVAGTFMVAWFLLSPVLASTEGSLTKTLDLLYPVLDVLLLGGAVLGMAIFAGGRLGRAWLILIAAFILDGVADIAFAYMAVKGTYYSGSISDLLYLWDYALFALAFYVHRMEL